MTEPLTMRAFHADDRTRDWRVVGDGATAVFRTGSLAVGTRLVQAIAAAVGDAGPHHLDAMPADLDHLAVGTPVLADGCDLFGAALGGPGLRRRLSWVLVGPADLCRPPTICTARSRSSAGCGFLDTMNPNFPRGHSLQGTRGGPERGNLMPDVSFTELAGRRVALRRFGPADVAEFMAYRSDPQVARYKAGTRPTLRKMANALSGR
jgi:hypothetical protein